jgi:hypothetical protein
MKTVRELWQGMTVSRNTREREAAAQRENSLRDDFARRAYALETQIAQTHAENCRLRAENRALLNSVLGIAGIPPVIVVDPKDLPFVGAQHAVPGADAWRDAAHTQPASHGGHFEERSDEESLLVSPGSLDAKPKRGFSSLIETAPQVRCQDSSEVHRTPATGDDGAVGGHPAPNAMASPSTVAGRSIATPLQDETPLASTPLGTNSAPPQKQLRPGRTAPRPRNDANVIAPIRRRSWHQIYRILEFKSSRRKDQDS